MIDVYDSNYNYLGRVDPKVAFRNGLWHRTFNCMVVLPQSRSVLLQKKHPGLYSSYSFDRPDHLDESVGGSYEAGEKIEDGVREIREELGLDVPYSDLIPIGVRQCCFSASPEYISNTFQLHHLLPMDMRLEDYPLGSDEVRGLVEINVDEGIELLLGKRPKIEAPALFGDSEGRRIIPVTITRDSFYTTVDNLFLRLFIAAKRFLDGEPRELIVL